MKVIIKLAERVVFLPSQVLFVSKQSAAPRGLHLVMTFDRDVYLNSTSITPRRWEDVSLAHSSMDELVSVASSDAALGPP